MSLIKKLTTVSLIIYSFFYLIQALTVIVYPYQVSYPEGFILNQAKLICEGKNIYKNIDHYPFIIANYPPIYLLICAGFIKLFGISFFGGRLVTFLATILIVFLIYKILFKKTTRNTAIFCALLFIASSYTFKDTPLMRVDMTGLFLSLFGLYLVIDTQKDLKLCYSIPFFLAALYTKPTFFTAPFALAIHLLLSERKKAIIFIFSMVISYLLLFFILNHFTAGEFYRHTILYNLNIFELKQAAKYYIHFLQTHAILFLFSLIFLFSPSASRECFFWKLYFIISTIVAVTVGKVGANTNYFCELIALTCILTGLAIEKLKNDMDDKKYQLFIYSAAMAQLILFLHLPFFSEPIITKTDWHDNHILSQKIQNTGGPILSEDAGILVLNQREVLFQPFEFTQLARQNIWNEEKFILDIVNRRFSLIILSFDLACFYDPERLTPTMAEAISANYYITDKIGEYFLYRPNLDKF